MKDFALIEESRARLLRDLGRISESAVNFQPTQGARTIAESLLHVAVVEFIFAVALAVRAGQDVPVVLWEKLKAGLAGEVGYEVPAGLRLEECTVRLEQVRNITGRLLNGAFTFLNESDLRRALQTLRDQGADLNSERLEALLPKLSSHLGVGSIGVILIAHEEYHRGQILLQNYLCARAAAPLSPPAK